MLNYGMRVTGEERVTNRESYSKQLEAVLFNSIKLRVVNRPSYPGTNSQKRLTHVIRIGCNSV